MKIKAWWHHSENFGDILTPYLLTKLTGRNVQFVNPEVEKLTDIYCLTGSLLGADLKGSIVLGLGSAFSNFTVRPGSNTEYASVRGPLSKAIVESAGYKVEFIGDGALILPRVYNPKINKTHKLGILQSWVDIDKVKSMYGNENEVLIIDTMRPVEDVINNMLRCEMTISGCLHGLIASMIYNIPTYHVKFSENMVGDGFKFTDFKQSVNFSHQEVYIKEKMPVADLIKLPFLPNTDISGIQDKIISHIK